jgi:hypothetical protein
MNFSTKDPWHRFEATAALHDPVFFPVEAYRLEANKRTHLKLKFFKTIFAQCANSSFL